MIRLTAVIDVEGQAPRALTHESNARSLVLGRDPSADFQLPVSTISRQHARISEADNVYFIEDLGSTHGTLVNGHKLEAGHKKVLRSSDIIELAQAKITCAIEMEKVALVEPGEDTQAIAARAVQGILGRLGDAQGHEPFLRILTGADEGKRFLLTGSLAQWSLGRSKDCECVLSDPNVSRRHALIKKDWNGFLIQDLGSKNGVCINDQPIRRPRRLHDQDEITIGPVRLIFIDPDADLLAALKDVPGFHINEDSEPERSLLASQGPDGDNPASQETGIPSFIAPDASGALLPPVPGGLPGSPPGSPNDAEIQPDELGIDPELLLKDKPTSLMDWLIIGGVAALVVASAAVLYALLT